METVTVPDIGDFTDVPVVEIHVKAGDVVAVEEPLVTLESDKATMDVPAPIAGTVEELLVSMDDTVSQGTAIATIAPADGGGETSAVPSDSEESAAVEAEAAAPPADEQPAKEAGAEKEEARAGDPSAGAGDPPYASPVARRMATALGVDLAGVQGSGRNERITKDDVQAAADGAPAKPTPAAPAERGSGVGDETIPLTRIQQRGAANLAKAWQTIPHVTHHDTADITELETFRKALNAEQSDVKVTMVALLLRATAASLREFPRFHSQLQNDAVLITSDLHLGFAADTPNGLVVPVIRDVDRKGILELAGELTELSAKAREGKLSPKEISGAVFTISSLGGIGGTGFTPIVNPPQVAILGVVRSAMQPVWDGEQFVPRLMLPISLSYDHRVIDGAAAARFCVHLVGVLTDLRRALL